MFDRYRPIKVIHLAGTVGGVRANMKHPVQFYDYNAQINSNVIKAACNFKVKKLICALSSCIYPDRVEYPIKEDYLHLGPPHESNFAYSYAKRMTEVQMRAYRKQYNCDFIGVIPTNIFGEHDNFNLDNSHVIPAIIRKIYEAKRAGSRVELWGDGMALRQFTYSLDIAKILLLLIDNECHYDLINIGDSAERSIKEVSEEIAKAMNFTGDIVWNTKMPKGQYRKPCDMSRLKRLGFKDFTKFGTAIKKTTDWLEDNYEKGIRI
tara:strand:+ start:517 stop:1308 length:792 start_codon:yes stop_codon:yes gene_type:complete